jgi:hypothetical protein
MNAYFAANRLSPDEKNDILAQHRTLYDGYRTMQPNVSNTQPLYVQDFAKDKVGAVINNKGVVKPYTNVGIHEQVEEREMCEQCGGTMKEDVCEQCGSRMEESLTEEGEMCEQCGGGMNEGECMECGWKGEVGAMEEGEGKLSDIYNVEDLGDSEFDYVQGGGNKYGTFEKMHHMKKIKNEQVEDDYIDNFEDPDNEDDEVVGTDDLEIDSSEMYEQGYTGGGNAPDMDISNVEPAYDFVSNGPMDVFPEGEMEEEECLDCDYETMESAWSDEELDEANDISGVQGIYGDMEPAFDFDSKGPGSAGPYQRSSWGGSTSDDTAEDDVYWQKDLAPNELDLDLEKFNPEDSSWEEIKAYTGDWDEIDEDLKESFENQKNKITEMMIRMKVLK